MRLLMMLALALVNQASAADHKVAPENAAATTPDSGWNCPKPDAARPSEYPKRPVSDEAVKDYAVELGCMVDWLSKYRVKGNEAGAVRPELYEKQRRRTRFLIAEISEWAKSSRISAPETPSGDDARRSQQHYLSGVVYYQKGDYEKARKEWKDSLRLDPNNQEAKAGVERIEKLYGIRTP